MEKTIRNMTQNDIYGISAELRKRSLALHSFIVRANSSYNEREALKQIRATTEELKQLFSLGKEKKALSSFKIFKKLMEHAETVAKQNEGRLKRQEEPLSLYKVIDFLEYFCKPSHTLVRSRVIKIFKTALADPLPLKGYELNFFRLPNIINQWKSGKLYRQGSRISMFSWKLQKLLQLDLFKTEERKRNDKK